MFDIEELSERFVGLDRYKIVCIHSDIPFEEQELAFLPTLPHEVKVVIATNAAESSITLPDVDMVICLGTHKMIKYDAKKNRSTLANCFISKASATQRAGRTGRGVCMCVDVRTGCAVHNYIDCLPNYYIYVHIRAV